MAQLESSSKVVPLYQEGTAAAKRRPVLLTAKFRGGGSGEMESEEDWGEVAERLEGRCALYE